MASIPRFMCRPGQVIVSENTVLKYQRFRFEEERKQQQNSSRLKGRDMHREQWKHGITAPLIRAARRPILRETVAIVFLSYFVLPLWLRPLEISSRFEAGCVGKRRRSRVVVMPTHQTKERGEVIREIERELKNRQMDNHPGPNFFRGFSGNSGKMYMLNFGRGSAGSIAPRCTFHQAVLLPQL